jgi:ketosteroid isomerase-like protein
MQMEVGMKRLLPVVLLAMSWTHAHAQSRAPLPAAEGQSNCANTGKDGVADLHRDWLMIGWERNDGDPDFNFRTDLGRYYDFTRKDLSLFDDFDPKLQARNTADSYGSIWYQFVPTFKSVHHKIIEEPSPIAVGPGYSHSILEFVFEVTPKKGDVMYLVSRSSILWRCGPDGWKIYREHNSARPIQPSVYKQAK